MSYCEDVGVVCDIGMCDCSTNYWRVYSAVHMLHRIVQRHLNCVISSKWCDIIWIMRYHSILQHSTSHHVTMCVTSHHIVLHLASKHHTSSNHTSSHYFTSHCNASHHMSCHHITVDHIALHCIASNNIWSPRLLGRVQGVVVHAKRETVGSDTRGNVTTHAGSLTSL